MPQAVSLAPQVDPLARLLSSRAHAVKPSASNAAAQRARELVASGRKIVNLTVGEPDFETPDNIKEAGIAAIRAGKTRYTTVDGTVELKEAIKSKFLRENNLAFATEEISVACGAKHIIFNAFLATIDASDEVVIPAPHWVSYPEMVRFAGGNPVIVSCPQAQRFKLRPEQLEAAITPRTKWLVLNAPGNPAGNMYSAAELTALGEVLRRHPHVWILSDDIYEHITYGVTTFSTMALAVPDLRERTLTINGVSKAYCMTGWRIGFAAGPKGLIKEMAKIQSQSTSSPSAISQAAATEALNGPQHHVGEHAREFAHRMKLVSAEFAKIPELDCAVPEGAFYLFPSCAKVIGKKSSAGTVIRTDFDMVDHLLNFGVATVSGTPFGMAPHFRISIAASEPALLEGCRQIAAACADLG